MYNFEKLEIYELAMEIADEVSRINRKFPNEENLGLTSQIKRAAISIVLNIAERTGQKTKEA